jgi:hypothetical protein
VATLAQPSAPVETPEPAVPDADALRRLLGSYQQLIDAAGARRSVIAVGTERFAVEHVRRALAMLERRYNAHAAMSDSGAPDTAESRERIRQFLASLAPPPSRVRALLLTALVLVVARPVGALAGEISWAELLQRTYANGAGGDQRSATVALVDAFSRVSDLSLGNLGRAVDVVLSTSLLTTSVVALVFGAAAYLVLRPLASGAIAFRFVRTGARSRWPWYRGASQPRLREDEAAVFDASGLRTPADPRLDIAVKACLAAPLLLLAIAWWGLFLSAEISNWGRVLFISPIDDDRSLSITIVERHPVDAAIAVTLGVYAALRLSWLAAEFRRRRTPLRDHAVAAVAALGILVATFALMSLRDTKDPSVVALASPITYVASWLADPEVEPAAGQQAVTVWLACDEPCAVEHAWLRDDSGERAGEVVARPSNRQTMPRSFWPTAFGAVDELGSHNPVADLRSSAHTQTVEILLSQDQVQAVQAAESRVIELEIRDDAGNRTNSILAWDFGI